MAAGVEIANAYISLQTKMPGVKRDIQSALGGSDVQGASKKAGGSMGQAVVAGLTAGLVGPALNVIGGIASKAGSVFSRGFARLISLDDAKAKLTGLGHSAESVESIMQNALASVRGTAFGMDQAAGVAGTLVAAGIAPGERLERTLKLVADAATIAGSDMGDMGSIFAKVAGTGKLTGEVVAQLGDRGIPVLTKLAQMYGVTTEEAQKMVSSGKVSFEDFAKVMDETLGGAALSSGDTFRGALANIGAALGRVGANLLGGIFPKLAPLFSSITNALSPLEDAAKGVGAAVGNFLAPAFDALTGLLNGTSEIGWLSTIFEHVGAAAKEVTGGVRAFFAAFMDGSDDITSAGFAGVLESFGVVARNIVDSGIVSYLSPLGIIFKVLQGVLPTIAGALGQVASTLGGALAKILPMIVEVAGQFVGVLANLAAQVIPMLVPIITMLADIVSRLLVALVPVVATLLTGLLPVFEAIVPVIGMLLEALMPIIEALMGAFMPIIEALIPVVTALLGAFLPLVATLVEALAPILQVVAKILSAILVPVINVVVGVIKVLASVITWLVQNVIAPYFKNVVVPVVKTVGEVFRNVFGGLGDFFAGIWNGIQAGFKGFINFLIDGINGFIQGLNGAGNFLSDITGGAISFKIPSIPRLADGGVVSASHGGTLAVIGEGGRDEAVVPLPPDWKQNGLGGGSGLTINGDVYTQDVDEFVRTIETEKRRAYWTAGVFA